MNWLTVLWVFLTGFFGRLLRLFLALAVGLFLLFFFMQRSMIYYPMQAPLTEQMALAQRLELLPWKNERGELLGWHTPLLRPEDQPLGRVVIFHGNAGYALHREGLIRILQETETGRHLDYFLFEYPGYGAREGQPSEAAFLETATAALATLAVSPPASDASTRLVLLGESLGTGVASALAANPTTTPSGVILLTPFDSLVSVAGHHFPWLPVSWILRDRYASSLVLPSFSGPVAFVMAEADEVVPAKYGRALAAGFPGPKLEILVPGSDHNGVVGLLSPEEWESILRFSLSLETVPSKQGPHADPSTP